MKKSFSIIAAIIVILFQYSCEPELVTSIEMPREDPKLAISAFLISGEATHKIWVGNSVPNNQPHKENYYIANAVIIISDGSSTVTLKSLGEGWYSFEDIELPVLPGKKYTLHGYAPGYSKEIQAECTIPGDFVPVFELLGIDTIVNDQYSNELQFHFRFLDIAGSKDFYNIFAIATFVRTSPIIDTSRNYMYTPESQPRLFSDANKDGGWFHFMMKTSIPYSPEKLVNADIRLLRTDEHYYKFHYPFIVGGYYGGGDAFFAEPTIIHSNVTNGYGIFAGALMKQFIFPV